MTDSTTPAPSAQSSSSSAYTYPSTFPNTTPSIPKPPSQPQSQTPSTPSPSPTGAFASFICHVAHLEKALQSAHSFFDNPLHKPSSRTRLGHGTSFLVDRVELQPGRYAVIKTVRQSQHSPTQWRDVLLEIRVLLHKPIRYHPNIVRLLDIGWDGSSEIASPFPALIQEYAEFGTLARIQGGGCLPLSFAVKQKLCYDVGRGLSILHGCGIVHGDLKHENVLVFANRYDTPAGQPYTAKVADFGGSVMDMTDQHSVPMNTFPYEAPEIGQKLSIEGVKKTDVFSYGMLIWRCMLDCQDVLSAINFSLPPGPPSTQHRTLLNKLKTADHVLESAITSLSQHPTTRSLPSQSLNLIVGALLFTLRGDASLRALDRAQARLRGMTASASLDYVLIKDMANRGLADGQRRRTPGRHGIDVDGVGYALGRVAGDDYDAQNNLPGFRPDLPQPETAGFLFEPLKLRRLLDWEQQQDMVAEFKAAAMVEKRAGTTTVAAGLEPWSAAFFLYQSFLSGFGVVVDGAEACRWLRSAAAASEETASVDYLAGAWLVRAHRALGVVNPLTRGEQMDYLYWGLIRGHRHCSTDARAVMESEDDAGRRSVLEDRMFEARYNHLSRTGGTGLPFFISRRLTRRWDTPEISVLDDLIRAELGEGYDSSLRQGLHPTEAIPIEPAPEQGHKLDTIFVNNKGHGLLHLVATLGNVTILQHLHRTYKCNLNLSNQSHSDTPLTCACRAGNMACALYLVENGADANGTQFGEESPLHCIVNFADADMDVIVGMLVAAGADMEKASNASRKDVRAVLADWEDSGSMRCSPLGRAVLYQSLYAVELLLRHGADPWARPTDSKMVVMAPVELAAVLTLPDILQAMLSHADADSTPLFDECGMLRTAHSASLTPYDALSLQSRIIRCGSLYKTNLMRTLRILRDRRLRLGLRADESSPGAQLCAEIELGNRDIVEALLDLGHHVNVHTNSSVRAIGYLAAAHADSHSSIVMSPLVNESKDLSAVHVVAGCRSRDWNEYSQISERIVQLVLEMFPTAEALGGHHVHPSVGTPLTAAVLAGNKSVVALLMESSFRHDVDRAVSVEYQLDGVSVRESLTPRELASKMAHDLTQRLTLSNPSSSAKDLNQLITTSEIMQQLASNNQDREAQVASSNLSKTIRAIKAQANSSHPQDPTASLPVDLSVVCEEKASGWREGVEMTEVMAHRTFLKAFRSADGPFGDGITGAMDKAFNKRPAELRSS
ncbi:hypothetical protein CDD80_4685 [Ophiocordyceps camponoti-rufipedis]|uniref:Protein kinase domain-containing protein n=1 Tax=Ophiocordyceps camponoti-rufipedis TaxID=2004952 RepID=A0A2C5YTV2_9HYPO|nr:hypothetical protein CDD80_4685 [Ophiocordyceps camponoti-rufipedis]